VIGGIVWLEPLNRPGCSVLVLCPTIWVVFGVLIGFIFGVGLCGMFEYVSRKQLLEFMSKQLIETLKIHEATGTLLDGKNLFLLHTGGASYKIIIERETKNV
jgi:hypothetical protein